MGLHKQTPGRRPSLAWPGEAVAGLSTILLFLSLAITPTLSHAQIFMCKDANGRTLTSDRPIPECASRATRELGNNGIVKREIPAPLTPEQKRQKQALEEQQKIEQAAIAEQKQQDQTLMARYGNLKALEQAHKHAREPFEERMNAASTTITSLQNLLKQTEEEKKFYKNKPLPIAITRKIEEAQLAIGVEKNNILQYAKSIVEIDTKFDAMIKRYREITEPAAPASAASSPGKAATPDKPKP